MCENCDHCDYSIFFEEQQLIDFKLIHALKAGIVFASELLRSYRTYYPSTDEINFTAKSTPHGIGISC